MNRPSNKSFTKQSWYAKTILPLMEDLKTEARISPYLHPFRLVNINIHVEE